MAQKCSDVLKDVVNEACKRNGKIKIDLRGFDKAAALCDMVEKVARQFEGISYGARVDEETYETYVYVECKDLISEDMKDPFIKALSLSSCVEFKRSKSRESFDIVFGCDRVFES